MVLHVGPSSVLGDEAHLTTFVQRLAGPADDGPAAAARRQIDARIAANSVPAGLRMLAEALAGSLDDGPPQPRHPAEDVDSVADAVRDNNLVVLEEFGDEQVAAALAALLRDGRRVVVTAADRGRLAALTEALGDDVVARCVDVLPALGPAEQRELRRLLATATPARRARLRQQLPAADRFPSVEYAARLVARAADSAGGPLGLLPGLLAGLDPDRRAAVTDVAGRADAGLRSLGPAGPQSWQWTLLSHLVQNRHRAAFDRLVEDTAQAAAVTERGRGAPPVSVVGPLPPDAGDALRRYAEFLRGGGRNRAYFRSPAQREVQPVLRQIRVGGMPPESPAQVQAALEHVELAERLVRIDAGCREIGVPAPRDAGALGELGAALDRIGAAARAVGALRHDVLFIHPNSPVAVPDLASAQQVATTILDHAEHGSAVDAARSLDELVGTLATAVPRDRMAPEHERAVAALRARDVASYAAAFDDLAAARAEIGEEQRCAQLLGQLRSSAPRVAEAWEQASRDGANSFGLAWFVEADRLLTALPPVDAADVVLLLGAAELGVDRLLLTAVAPRLAAVVEPGARPAGGATLLGVLQRATALVVRGGTDAGGTGGRVVHLPAGRTRAAGGSVRQAPA